MGLLRLRDAHARKGYSYHEAPFWIAAGKLFNCSKDIVSGASISIIHAGRCFWGTVDVRLFAVSRKVFAEAVRVFDKANVSSIDANHGSKCEVISLIILQSTVN